MPAIAKFAKKATKPVVAEAAKQVIQPPPDQSKSFFQPKGFDLFLHEEYRTANPMLHIVDASDWIHRSFHAVPKHFTCGDIPTNALYGFVRQLIGLLEVLRAGEDEIVLAFDAGKTWRHSYNPNYKQGREIDIRLTQQLTPCRNAALAFLGEKHCVSVKGLEADDIIAELSEKSKKDVMIHTRDQDVFQLVSPKIKACVPGPKGTKTIHDVDSITEKYGLPPSRLIDLWGMTGQSSDGISGVNGIGIKGATRLLLELGDKSLWDKQSIAIIRNILGEKKRQKLLESKEEFLKAQEIMRLPCNRSHIKGVPMNFLKQDYTFGKVDVETADRFIVFWELFSMQKDLQKFRDPNEKVSDC